MTAAELRGEARALLQQRPPEWLASATAHELRAFKWYVRELCEWLDGEGGSNSHAATCLAALQRMYAGTPPGQPS